MKVESLTPINSEELLAAVKISNTITGDNLDRTLQAYIDEIKEYLKGAGVPHSGSVDVVGSTLAIGCISVGVSNLFNDGKLSDYFYQRADQLRHVEVVKND